VVDDLAANNPHTYEWICHFQKGVTVENSWIKGDAGDGQLLGVGILAPKSFEATTGNDGLYFIHLRPTEKLETIRIVNLLYPINETSWHRKPNFGVAEDNGSAVCATVYDTAINGQIDRFLLKYDRKYQGTIDLNGYRSDAQLAFISRALDDQILQLFIFGGSILHDSQLGIDLIMGLKANKPLEAEFSNQTVNVYGSITSEIKLFAPRAESLFVNTLLTPFTREGDYILFDGDSQIPNEELKNEIALVLSSIQNAKSTLEVVYKISESSIIRFRLFDLAGKLINTLMQEEKTAGIYKINLELSGQTQGVYFIEMYANSNSIAKKFILIE